jgi:hypothetical protein
MACARLYDGSDGNVWGRKGRSFFPTGDEQETDSIFRY